MAYDISEKLIAWEPDPSRRCSWFPNPSQFLLSMIHLM